MNRLNPASPCSQVFPGSFHYVRGSVHRPVHGLEFQSESMAVNGLSVISSRSLSRDWGSER